MLFIYDIIYIVWNSWNTYPGVTVVYIDTLSTSTAAANDKPTMKDTSSTVKKLSSVVDTSGVDTTSKKIPTLGITKQLTTGLTNTSLIEMGDD